MGNGLILFAHHDAVLCGEVRTWLVASSFDVVVVSDGAAAMAELHRVELDVAVIELALPARGGLDVLAASHHLCPDTEVVVVADPADQPVALACIAGGAFGHLQTPLDLHALLLMITRAVERRSLRATTRLFEASQEILRTPDQALLAAAIVELVARVLEADHVTLSLATVDGGMRERHASAITPELRELVAAEVGEHVATAVARLGRPVLLPEDAAEMGLSGPPLDRVRSCIVYPLSTGHPVGVLTLSRISDNRPYRHVDIQRTAVLASQALLAVENAALNQRMLEAERLAAVGNLAAGVAHEINNPLTYVVASADHALEQISLECLARLAAMVPPPRYPLLRLHGVLAPRHKWRARVVPRPPESYAECTKSSAKRKNATAAAEPRAEAAGVSRIQRGEPTARRGEAEPALLQTAEVVQTSTLLVTGAASRVAPNILSIAHWDRLLGGQLYAPHSRLDWATLLRRTFDVDVKRCTGCASRMTVRAVVTDGASIARLLRALRRSRDPPVAA